MDKQLLICKFMGASVDNLYSIIKASRVNCEIAHLIDNCPISDLEFDKSWDWLLPVWYKISNSDIFYGLLSKKAKIMMAICDVNIESTFEYIVEIIKCVVE